MTAPSQNRLLVVRLPSGRVVRQARVPGEPEYAAEAGLLVVVGAQSKTVSLLAPSSLRPVKAFRGFVSPHIVAISPHGEYAYVTDDATGRVTAIGLRDEHVASSLEVGRSAHHLAFRPVGSQVWIALGEQASTIAVLSAVSNQPNAPPSVPALDFGRPHLIGRFRPGFLAHDLLFSPDSKQVWITSADTAYTSVFRTRSHRLLFRVRVGAPPQHIAIAGRYAYLTSGYGSRIEQVRLSTGLVIRRAPAPYGSFEIAAAGDYVVTVSLLRGTLAIYSRRLRLLRMRKLAPSLEDVIPFTP